MTSGQPPKKRKTRCNGTQLAAACFALQTLKETITAQPIEAGLPIDPELSVEIEGTTLIQLDGLLKWMDSIINSSTKVYPFTMIADIWVS